jgi:hypothetical protein
MADRGDDRADEPKKPLSRRELIKRGLALGSLPYVAPMILGSAKPAAAQIVSGPGCAGVIDDCEDENEDTVCFEEGGEPLCGCIRTVEGDIACIIPECGADPCDDSDDCDPGFFCIDVGDLDNTASCDCEIEQFCVESCALLQTVSSTIRTPRARWPGFSSLR